MCSGSERYEKIKNGRTMLKCICAECGVTKTKFVKNRGKLIEPSQDGGSFFDMYNSHSLGEMALKGALNTGIFAARKGLAKAVKSNVAKRKVKNVASKYIDQALDSFMGDVSKKIDPGKIGSGYDYDMRMYAGDRVDDPTNPLYQRGDGIDIHKLIGKLPTPKGGWTLPGHRYTGPYNDLDSQVKYDPVTGEILEIYDRPTGRTDEVSMRHDVDYSVCKDDRKCKNEADRKMVKALDNVPYHERQWGHWLARNMINTKQTLGLGVKQRKTKNGKGRRVRKTGKKN